MNSADSQSRPMTDPCSGPRVVVFGFSSPGQIELLARLAETRKWNVVHWIGSHPEAASVVARHFPRAQFQAKLDARANSFPASIPKAEWPVRDVGVIREMAHHDPVLHPVFLRQARTRGGLEQMAEYHEAITTWYCFVDHLSPDLLVYDNIPAHIYDYLPYLLCQKRGIPTLLLLRPMQVPGLIMPTNRFEQPPPRIANRYAEILSHDAHETVKLDHSWSEYFGRMAGDYEGAMYSSFARQYALDGKGEQLKLRGNVGSKLRDIARRALAGRPYRFQVRSLVYELRSMPRRYRLRRFYEKLASSPDYQKPYVFVPLHVQPERTSVPQGGIFGHQLLMVECLSRALPAGWELYVKEHPVQLYSRPASRNFRSPSFYRELARFKNVRLIPCRISARKLIDHSRAVASATSTACWEAIFQSRPALVFGDVFFTFFEGVFHVRTYSQCADALSKIEQGYEVDPDRLRAGLYAMQLESLPVPAVTAGWASRNTDSIGEARWNEWLALAEQQIDDAGRVRSRTDSEATHLAGVDRHQ